MKFSISLMDSQSDITNNILNQLKVVLDKALIKTANIIEFKIRSLLEDALKNEPEYSSLINGELRKELGIADVSNVDIVISHICNTAKIDISRVKTSKSGLSGGILLTVIPRDMGNIVNQSSAMVIDNERGYSLPWLEWLLFKGGDIIIRNFEVQYGVNPRSRSGDAIMVSSNSNWRVPAQFAGTIGNNWTTRAVSRIESKVTELIKTELEKAI